MCNVYDCIPARDCTPEVPDVEIQTRLAWPEVKAVCSHADLVALSRSVDGMSSILSICEQCRTASSVPYVCVSTFRAMTSR